MDDVEVEGREDGDGESDVDREEEEIVLLADFGEGGGAED